MALWPDALEARAGIFQPMKNKTTARDLVAIGLALTILPNVLGGALAEEGNGVFGGLVKVLMLVGLVVYVGGLCLVAKNRGRSWAWGLTGLCCVVGGVVVLFLKPRPVS